MNLGAIIPIVTAVKGLIDSGGRQREARRLEHAAASVTERDQEMAREQLRLAEEHRRAYLEWFERRQSEGAFSADAMVERGKQDIADYEQRGMNEVSARARAAGADPRNSQTIDNHDRVAISAREALADLRAQIQPQLTQMEGQAILAGAPNPGIAGAYQSIGDQAYRTGMTQAASARAGAASPAALLASILPFLERRTGQPAQNPVNVGQGAPAASQGAPVPPSVYDVVAR